MSEDSDDYSYPPFSASIAVNDAETAIEFYKAAFGATERYRLTDPESGKIGHAELLIADTLLMLAEETPEWNQSPKTLEGTTVKFSLIVENADEGIELALSAGATLLMPATDMFYGFRSGTIEDPYGHQWLIQHEIEKVSPEEMQRRWEQMVEEEG